MKRQAANGRQMTRQREGSLMNPALVKLGAISATMTMVLGSSACQSTQPPKLAVIIAVDQMRADYLTRFSAQWTGGLARLERDGAVFTDAHQDHAAAKTAVGHATIVTGVFPARHGIVNNDWWDRKAHQQMYAVGDTASPILGHPERDGRSPVNLERETLGDWLKRTSPRSKVFSVALKDRVAVLMGGKAPDGVYWYDPEVGRIVTSTYYANEYPQWIEDFHRAGRLNAYFDSVWTKLLPDSAYALSREDDFAAEAPWRTNTFPHTVALPDTGETSRYSELWYTPFGDEVTFAFVRELIEVEGLGADDVPDVLLVGMSTGDKIGHRYGPYSQEIQDYYLRLDRMLGAFLGFLDDRVGANNYFVVLTSDHGVAPVPEELTRRGVDARRVNAEDLDNVLLPHLRQVLSDLGITTPPRPPFVYPDGLVFDFPNGTVPDEELRAALSRSMAERLEEEDFVVETFTYEEMVEGTAEGQFVDAYLRSFHPDRAPDIMILFKQYYAYFVDSTTAADHGSPYAYDMHVPIMFYGPDIAPGAYDSRVRTVDIAPTIAMLLGISAPDDLDGSTLRQAIR